MDDVSELPLALDDYRRYGRQMVLDNFGLSGKSKVDPFGLRLIFLLIL